MSKTTRVSSVANKRVQTSYVNRVKRVEKNEAVDSVKPVEKISNSAGHYSSNYTLASDIFYKKLEELKKEFKSFYHDHRRFEEAVEILEQGDEDIVIHIKNLIEKYNTAFKSLKILDKTMNTTNAKDIAAIIDVFKTSLTNIAIDVDEDYYMTIQEETFIEIIRETQEPLKFLFEPIQGMIFKLYKAFKSIKYLPKEGLQEGYENPLDKHLTGIVMNQQG
ncbi:hypothetical protein SAMN05660297_03472 [Natronincola peptidivorans]|uniref:Uncharacterized protein n=1 Tax=Natronincola peptidivorans TaxID=426128 RepID=A0A1I0H2C2_9FIRM|nr:hypothetical protein [Natronincola peptidivorans]SET77681.1 hypothetical protein SAMN05660297_03472 [Natronincola peptidivorans]